MSNMSMTLAEFARLLDVYGGERTRWPADARAAAAHLLGRDGEARRLLVEAEALDRVLGRAPVPGIAAEAALAERIVAAAQRSPRIVKLPGMQPTQASAEPVLAAATRIAVAGKGREPERLYRMKAGSLGVLAASLMFGVLIGISSLPPRLLPGFADMAGADRDELVQIALSDEVMQ